MKNIDSEQSKDLDECISSVNEEVVPQYMTYMPDPSLRGKELSDKRCEYYGLLRAQDQAIYNNMYNVAKDAFG
jgi:hypothetical protein